MQDFIVIQTIVQALGSEAELGMGNSFIFRLWNMEFFFIVQCNDEEFFPKIVTSNMEVFSFNNLIRKLYVTFPTSFYCVYFAK